MTMTSLLCAIFTIVVSRPVPPPASADVVAEVPGLRFHSDFLLNLHHTLYGAAWARRPEAGTLRALAGRLPAPVYRRHFWPAHDRTNRAWIAATSSNVKAVGPDVVKRLGRLYGVPWFTSPVRIDVVWVGNPASRNRPAARGARR